MALKTITAKFNGKCSKCTSFLAAGSTIKFNTDTRKAECMTCPAKPVAAPTKPALTRIAAAEIIVRRAGAEALKANVSNQWELVRSEMMDLAAIDVVQRGVCEKCQGTNSVCSFATLDGSAYSEFGSCPDCKGEYPAKGFKELYKGGDMYGQGGGHLPSVYSDWSNVAITSDTATRIQTLAKEFTKLADALHAINLEINDCNELLKVRRGAVVEVVKGRKVAVGTKGEVFWMGGGKFGDRVGIKDAQGNTHWTAAANVEVVEAVA